MSKGPRFERAQLVDIGVNFQSAQLVSVTNQLLMRARAANVSQILATGAGASIMAARPATADSGMPPTRLLARVTGAVLRAAAPFGGVKQSGLGCEGGQHHGIAEIMEAKYIATTF